MGGPLEGLRIIEFAGLGPGPFCGMMLADHGAEVTRTNAPRTMAGGPDIVRPLLSGLGLDEAEIDRLRERNIVA